MTIISTLPVNLQNGTLEDATQVMSNFNWIVSQVNANAIGPGANSTITSLSGLTTALSVAQGGTGSSIAATALGNLGGIGAATTDTLSNKTLDATCSLAGNAATATTATTAGNGVPVGTIIDFAGTTAPSGYLACPTSATNISRTTYAALFAAIGTTWGAGDGSTTFGMPWFPADYVSVQANANVGTSTVGQNLSHTHDVTNVSTSSGQIVSYTSYDVNVYGNGTRTSKASGGTANLAAGQRILKCVKY